MKHLNNPVVIAFSCSVALVLIGSIFFPQFLSINYLLKQLHMASFLGVVATGAMIIILMGHIDLSVPWTLTVAAIVSCAIAGGELGALYSAEVKQGGFSAGHAGRGEEQQQEDGNFPRHRARLETQPGDGRCITGD